MRPAAQTPTPTTAQQPVSSTAEEPTVTLEQAVELAWQHVLHRTTGSAVTTSRPRRVCRSAVPANLSFSSGASLRAQKRFNPQTNTTVSGSNDSYSAGLWHPSTCSRPAAGAAAGRPGYRRGARVGRRAASPALQAKQSFFDVRRADELIRVAEARHACTAVGAGAQRRIQVGSGTRPTSCAQLETSPPALLRRSHSRAATYALGTLIGADDAAQPGEEVAGSLALTDEERSSRRAAVAGRSDGRSRRHRSEGLRSAHTQYFPRCAPVALRLVQPDASFNGGRTSWRTRLSLSYPIFNGFSKGRGAARECAGERQQDQLTRRRRCARTRTRVTGLRLAEEQIALAAEAVEVAARTCASSRNYRLVQRHRPAAVAGRLIERSRRS